MTNTPVILTRDLTKSYGSLKAVQRLNLSVETDRITAFLGQNGAGKSTTIKMLLGMIRPSSGDGTVLGKGITDARENREMRRKVAYVAENKPLYGYMSVEQTVRFASSFYPHRRREQTSQPIQITAPAEGQIAFQGDADQTRPAAGVRSTPRPAHSGRTKPKGLIRSVSSISSRLRPHSRQRASLIFSLRSRLPKLSASRITSAFSTMAVSW